MNINIVNDAEEMSDLAAGMIREHIIRSSSTLMCTATGNTPTLTYRKLVRSLPESQREKLSIIKLDEWGGIPMDHPQTCESYLRAHLLGPLGIPESRYTGFRSDPDDPEKEVARIQEELRRKGPIDLCILGLGMNGHIAFNEPADFVQPDCHVASLSESSLHHPMAVAMKIRPGYGLTIGMKDIMLSSRIILLIGGAGKKEISEQLFSGKISSRLPASYLWLHPDTVCIADARVLN